MDLEEIWAIEDAREETDAPLVFGMTGDQGEAGYDAQSRTFYYTLGMENGSEWPEIQLSAYGEPGVRVVWVDDYSYDWCSDAIAAYKGNAAALYFKSDVLSTCVY